MSTMERLRERVEAGAPVGELLRSCCSETGYLEALRGRADDRGAGPDREPRGARAGRARVRRDGRRTSGSLGEFLQQIALLADADTLPRRRGPRDADDDAQRQGPRVPDRVHHRDGGRRLPALARARRGRRWRRSGGSPTSASPARCATSRSPTPAAATSFGGATRPALRSRFLDEIPRELTDQPARSAAALPAPGRVASWAGAAAAAAERRGGPTTAAHGLPLGDDVVHAAFGEGVVTGSSRAGSSSCASRATAASAS